MKHHKIKRVGLHLVVVFGKIKIGLLVFSLSPHNPIFKFNSEQAINSLH